MFIKTVGSCMMPLIKSGTIIFVKKTTDVGVGDIVLYTFYGQKYLHRIIGKSDNFFVIQDDVGVTEKIYVPKYKVIGIYPCIIRGWVGIIYNFIIRKTNYFLKNVKRWLI